MGLTVFRWLGCPRVSLLAARMLLEGSVLEARLQLGKFQMRVPPGASSRVSGFVGMRGVTQLVRGLT